MTAQLIDGNALSKQMRAQVAIDAAKLTAQGVKPGLAVVLVGENPASQVYVRNKVKACEEVGIQSYASYLEEGVTQEEPEGGQCEDEVTDGPAADDEYTRHGPQ